MTYLKPCKHATMKLQGNVSVGNNAKGAIWQVLPVLGDLMKGFEEARQRHRPAESYTQDIASQTPLSPPATQQPTRPTNTRRRQRAPIGRGSVSATTAAASSESDIALLATPAASQIIAVDAFAESQIGASFTTLERHVSANINAAWQKLDQYYTRTDDTPIYRAAVLLHPLLKWRWFERYWETKPAWRVSAREVIAELWKQYKPITTGSNTTARPVDDDDDWS